MTENELTRNQEKILDQIDKARQSIKTDDFSMSIGEVINLYKDGDIKLDPAFQRLFRWEDNQKTKLIESILIGIPIPEIFVAQKSDGTWHVVDGVQRLSTILQLAGRLEKKDPLIMTTCKYIPSLEGKKWADLPLSTQREFKRSKIKINIILTQNSDEAQYELFQRLNTGGTSLSDQEVRNCLILMVSPEFFEQINKIKNDPDFLSCIKIKQHDIDEEYHMELILRMFIGYENIVDYKNHGAESNIILSEFIDKETINLIKNGDIVKFTDAFERTFKKLKTCLSDNSFLKYDIDENKRYGSFNVSVFEMLTVGISSNIDKIENIGNKELKEKINNLFKEEEVQDLLSRGTKAIKRFKGLTKFSIQYFSK
ncbi:DUF262 domain-containing protein [Photobacterium damselae]|uniref:DUF262 domain-containing protein n=1 Tax=Photobacterium damselae TaxID=38293 RepID=UPI0040676996